MEIFNITQDLLNYFKSNLRECEEQYFDLINSAKSRGLDKTKLDYYTEKHHIIPRCMNGTNDEDNLVLLTYREHIIAHMFLYILYPDNRDLFLSFSLLIDLKDKNFSEGLNIDLESLDELKSRKSEYMRDNNPMKNPEIAKKVSEAKKGVPTGRSISHSQETRDKISNTLKEYYSVKENHPFYGKHHTQESIEKISQNRKGKGIGRVIPEEHKQKLREYQNKAVIGPDGTEYESIKVAAEANGMNRSNLSRIVNHNPASGWKFKQ